MEPIEAKVYEQQTNDPNPYTIPRQRNQPPVVVHVDVEDDIKAWYHDPDLQKG